MRPFGDRPQQGPSGETRPLPGARTSCALLTLMTVVLAWPDPPEVIAVFARPAYFTLLTWFFWRASRASVALHSNAMRLICGGFFVLWLGYTLAATIHVTGLDREYGAFFYLRSACERGAWFLLGTTLTAYGLMLWIPQLVRSHELLAEHSARQEGALQRAADVRTELEERLVDADRRGMLGELAASIAHDLRNPLTIVKGTAESLCRKPRTAAEVAEHTDVIRRNIEKADETIESLIDLARPTRTETQELDAQRALDEVADLLRVEARRRGVTITLPRGPRAIVFADRTLLAQVLMNLALNAVEATRGGGDVRLRAEPRGAYVAVSVEDRGCGLTREVRRELFQPFFTTKETGTGLGLTGCRRIARELGGDLRLYPRARGGARAGLWLPRADALPNTAQAVDGDVCPASSC